MSGRDLLAIMPTGAGKSLCFQIPALMMSGITIVVSPLISLMKNHVAALKANGVPAAYINSSLTEKQIQLALSRAAAGQYKIIYAAPERLNTYSFRQAVLRQNISMVVVDEAHCVSMWGHEFRPEYRRIPDFIHSLPRRPVCCAFTATATKEVRSDILESLELHDPHVATFGFDRPNLYYEVIQPRDKEDALLHILREAKGASGIIYCLSRRDVEDICDMLNHNGLSATRYHAGLSDQEKSLNQDDFQFDRKKIMVATNAFGMGIDKSNVRFVIHHSLPLSLEAYYQEAGRAGRDGLPARCILLFSGSDRYRAEGLLNSSQSNPNLTEEENELIRERNRARFEKMIQYCLTWHCLRATVLQYFGEKPGTRCSGCSNCLGTAYPGMAVKKVRQGAAPRKTAAARPDPFSHLVATSPFSRDILYTASSIPKKEKKIRTVADAPQPQEKSSVTDMPVVDDPLYQALVEARSVLAGRINMPPYIICSDAVLFDLYARMPRTPAELEGIPGLSPAKIRSYGKTFLGVIQEQTEKDPSCENIPDTAFWSDSEKNMVREMLKNQESVYSISQKLARPLLSTAALCRKIQRSLRQLPAGAGTTSRPWNARDINWLKTLAQKDMDVRDIARQMGRTREDVQEKLRALQPE